MLKKINKKILIKIILILLVISWMALVFYFSNQPSKVSNSQSNVFVEKIMKIFFEEKSFDLQFINGIEFFIRKLAHISLYILGGILIFLMISQFNIIKIKVSIITFLIGFMYASTDEIHQLFIQGRSCEFRDVIIDSIGITIAIIIMLAIDKIFILKRRKCCEK